MTLEFNKSMYADIEGFVGRRQIFRSAMYVVDFERLILSPVARYFGQSPLLPRVPSFVADESLIVNAATTSESPMTPTLEDDTSGSTGRKRKVVGTNNLADYIKDFNHEYFARVQAKDTIIHTWGSDILTFDTAKKNKNTKSRKL